MGSDDQFAREGVCKTAVVKIHVDKVMHELQLVGIGLSTLEFLPLKKQPALAVSRPLPVEYSRPCLDDALNRFGCACAWRLAAGVRSTGWVLAGYL